MAPCFAAETNTTLGSNYLCMLCRCSHVPLFATPWTIACQALLSMGFSRQKYWSGLPCPPLGNLPNPGINSCLLGLLHWQAGVFTTSATWEAQSSYTLIKIIIFLKERTSLVVWASLIVQLVKNVLAMQETSIQFLGLEDPLEKE